MSRSTARERAILVLELASDLYTSGDTSDIDCAWAVGDCRWPTSGQATCRRVPALIFAAHCEVIRWYVGQDFATTYLEAAALLRDGWSPGERARGINGAVRW